jgi:lipopolysaccharide biosynthesis glycosyltransferase
VLAGRIKLLDPRWNTTAQAHAHPSRWRFLPPNLQRDAATQRRHNWITHYTGPKKPWSNPWVWRAGAWWESALKTGLAWPGGNLLRSLGRARGVLWTIWHGRRGEV